MIILSICCFLMIFGLFGVVSPNFIDRVDELYSNWPIFSVNLLLSLLIKAIWYWFIQLALFFMPRWKFVSLRLKSMLLPSLWHLFMSSTGLEYHEVQLFSCCLVSMIYTLPQVYQANFLVVLVQSLAHLFFVLFYDCPWWFVSKIRPVFVQLQIEFSDSQLKFL